jgi:hypothetical protein
MFRIRLGANERTIVKFWTQFLARAENAKWAATHPALRGKTLNHHTSSQIITIIALITIITIIAIVASSRICHIHQIHHSHHNRQEYIMSTIANLMIEHFAIDVMDAMDVIDAADVMDGMDVMDVMDAMNVMDAMSVMIALIAINVMALISLSATPTACPVHNRENATATQPNASPAHCAEQHYGSGQQWISCTPWQ